MHSDTEKNEHRLLDYVERVLNRPRSPGEENGRFETEASRPVSIRPNRPLVHTARVTAAPAVARSSGAVVARKPRPAFKAVARVNKLKVRPAIANLTHRAKLIPTITVRPVPPPPRNQPVRSGDMLLWPDAPESRAYFALAQPRLVDLDLSVERDADQRVTGGTLTLVVAIYPDEDAEALTQHHETWTRAIQAAGVSTRRPYRFLPISLSRLDAVLELPSGHVEEAPRASTNAQLGTATFLVELSSTGALSWRDALDRAGLLPGLCRLTQVFSSQGGGSGLGARQFEQSVTLQSLAGHVGSENIRFVNREQSFNATLVIAGDAMIETSAVEMRTQSGTSRSQVFDSDGGTLSLEASTPDLSNEKVTWSARIGFQASAWPAIRAGGELSATAGWAELLNPSSWTRQVSVTAILVDDSGRVVSGSAESSSSGDRITGSLDFNAGFLEGEGGLQTTFETSDQVTANVVLPRPPGTDSSSELKLTLFALRAGRDNMLVRDVAADEQWILVKVYPDARIEVKSNQSPDGEFGADTSLRDALDELSVESESGEMSPVVTAPDRVSASSAPPTFSVQSGSNRYWALEIATQTDLLLGGDNPQRESAQYWFSGANSELQTGRSYRLPMAVWARLRQADQIYYRLWTSRATDRWVDAQVSVPDALVAETPAIEIGRP